MDYFHYDPVVFETTPRVFSGCDTSQVIARNDLQWKLDTPMMYGDAESSDSRPLIGQIFPRGKS